MKVRERSREEERVKESRKLGGTREGGRTEGKRRMDGKRREECSRGSPRRRRIPPRRSLAVLNSPPLSAVLWTICTLDYATVHGGYSSDVFYPRGRSASEPGNKVARIRHKVLP